MVLWFGLPPIAHQTWSWSKGGAEDVNVGALNGTVISTERLPCALHIFWLVGFRLRGWPGRRIVNYCQFLRSI